MPCHEAVAPAIPPRPDAPRPPRRAADLSPLLALIAAGAFALTDEQFEEALAELRRELAPTGVLESLFVTLLVEAAEMLRVASRHREQIAAGDPKWTRIRASAERSFWKALKALKDGRKPARPSKSAGSQATAEAPEPARAEAGRVEPETPAPAPPAPAPVAPVPASAQAESEPRPDRESIFLGKSPEVIRNLIAATAPRSDSYFLDLAIIPPQGGPARDGRRRPRR